VEGESKDDAKEKDLDDDHPPAININSINTDFEEKYLRLRRTSVDFEKDHQKAEEQASSLLPEKHLFTFNKKFVQHLEEPEKISRIELMQLRQELKVKRLEFKKQ